MASRASRTRRPDTRAAARGASAAPHRDGDPGSAPEHLAAGNAAVTRLLAGGAVRRSPAAGAGSDGVTGGAEVTADLAQRIDARRGGGSPLPDALRVPMQEHLGTDLGGVRVHTDAAAADLSRSLAADAFTSGQDVFFAAGRYSPGSTAGRELIAHEAVHVAQGSTGSAAGGTVSRESDAVEVEARAHAPAVARAVDAPRPAPQDAAPDDAARVHEATPAEAHAMTPAHGAARTSAHAHDGLHRSPGEAGLSVGGHLAVAALEELRHEATRVTWLAGAYSGRGIQTVDALRASAVGASDTYTRAYERYSRVIGAAGEEARNQQDWVNIFVGIGIGVGVGLLSAAIVPEGLALGWAILAETAGEATEAAVAAAVQASGITAVEGTDLQPGGLDPHVLSTAMWRNLAQLYRGVLGVQTHTQYLPLVLGTTEYALGQLRLVEAGVPADMTQDELVEMATSMSRSTSHLRSLAADLTQRLTALDDVRETAAAVAPRGVGEVEQDVWVLWMATVPDSRSDVLDLDAIEDHLAAIGMLGEGSTLGVDFGMWTSTDDEREALAAARSLARGVQARYDALQ